MIIIIDVLCNLRESSQTSPAFEGCKSFVKLVGQACVPEVTIIEPRSGKREQTLF